MSPGGKQKSGGCPIRDLNGFLSYFHFTNWFEINDQNHVELGYSISEMCAIGIIDPNSDPTPKLNYININNVGENEKNHT